jgi:hypothetical protein
MPKVIFLKQHTIWLPKCWVVVTLGIITMYLLWFGVKNIANYLAISEPKYGDYLVVDGWLDTNSLDQALQVFSKTNSSYKYLVTVGGPDTRSSNSKHLTYAEQSARYFLSKGVGKKQVVVISTPASAQARTYLSAVKLRDWFVEKGKENVVIDVFTGGVHARRTLFLYNLAFRSNIDIGVYAAEPSGFDLKTWWKTSEGAKSTITEFLGLVWVACFFDPGEYGSHQEKWGG